MKLDLRQHFPARIPYIDRRLPVSGITFAAPVIRSLRSGSVCKVRIAGWALRSIRHETRVWRRRIHGGSKGKSKTETSKQKWQKKLGAHGPRNLIHRDCRGKQIGVAVCAIWWRLRVNAEGRKAPLNDLPQTLLPVQLQSLLIPQSEFRQESAPRPWSHAFPGVHPEKGTKSRRQTPAPWKRSTPYEWLACTAAPML